MSDDELAGLDFRQTVRSVHDGTVVKSLLHNYLYDAAFPEFDLNFPAQQMERAPDGWFHPSTHPLWTDRQLYHYLADPMKLIAERKQYMGTLSVTMGTAVHGFVEMCLTDAKIRPAALQVCQVCPPERNCPEAGAIDLETRSRGHMDGILDLSAFGNTLPDEAQQPVFEFKTSNQMKLRNVNDLDLDVFMAKWPDYYAQVQEYMRMSNRRMAIVLFMSLGYPWEMREFHVPYNHAFAQGIRDKYRRVIDLVANSQPPSYLRCCGKPKSCPARTVCTIGA